MFFTRCIVGLVGCLPVQWKSTGSIRLALDYDGHKERLIAWHRAELLRLDSVLYLRLTSPNLIEDWKKAVREYS